MPEETAGSLSVILTGGATDKPCNCSSYIRTPSLKYTNSISQCQIEPAPHLHLTQSCLRLCRAHCLDFPIVSVCKDATEAPVGKVTVAKDRPIIYSGPRRPKKGPISWRNTRFRPRRPQKGPISWRNTRSRPRYPQKGPISWTNGPIDDCFATGRWLWSTCGQGSRDKSVDRRWSCHA